jgi:hypothetical protein
VTEELTYCVRGCVSPCECQACQECAQPIHPPPRCEAADGTLLCDRDLKRLRTWLGDIPDLYATLPLIPGAGEETEHRGKKPKPAGDVSPVRLDVITLQDPRTAATDRSSGDPWDGSVYIPGEVGTWALLLAEERNITTGIHTLTEAVGLLQRWFRELCSMPWIDECYDAIRDVHRLLQNAHRIERPAPLGRCLNVYERGGRHIACQAMLYGNGTAKVRCQSCGARYDGTGLLLVKRQKLVEDQRRETAS